MYIVTGGVPLPCYIVALNKCNERSEEICRSVTFKIAEAHSCTCTSGILAASCMAGVTMFMLSLPLPSDRKMCPSSTRLHEVSRFRSSALAILSVSRR